MDNEDRLMEGTADGTTLALTLGSEVGFDDELRVNNEVGNEER